MDKKELQKIADACFEQPGMADTLYLTSDGQVWLPQYKSQAQDYIRHQQLVPSNLFKFDRKQLKESP